MKSRAVKGAGAGKEGHGGAKVAAWWRHPAVGSALLALLLYLPVFRYGFVRDDRELFADNPFVRAHGYLWMLLSSDFWSSSGADSGLWRPLVTLSYWVDGRLGGWLPAWFHTVNLLSHVAVTALVAWVVVAFGAPVAAAWVAGLLFAVMPAHVEPVAWISGRTDVWCALFGLLAIALHLRSNGRRGVMWRTAAALAFLLALFSKESAAPLLVVLGAIEWRRSAAEGRARTVFLELAPYAALAAAWAVLHQRVAPGALAVTPGWANPSFAERLWTALAILPGQLAFLLPGFPHGPNWEIDPARSLADWRVAVGLMLHLGAIALLVRSWRSRTPVAPAVLVLWLPLALMGAVTLSRGALFPGERHIYLASAGAAWLVGIGGFALWKRGLQPTTFPRWILPVLGGVVLVLGVLHSLEQLAGWRNDETMYRAIIHAQPGKAQGHLGLALVMIGQHNDRIALAAIQHAERIDSTRYEAATYRAAIASRRGDWSTAIQWSRNAIRRGATEADPWLMEIHALQQMKLLPWSRILLDTLMAHHKNDPDVAAAFGRQMIFEGAPVRAVKPLEYAIGWHPDDPSLHLLLGDALVKLQHYDRAIEEFRRASGLDPGSVDTWLRLAAVYHGVGEFGARDDAVNNAASLPGADTTSIRRFYQRLLAVPRPAVLDSLKKR